MAGFQRNIVLLLLVNNLHSVVSVAWERIHCAADGVQEMPVGKVDNIGRFPWLGIVQHSFYVAGKTHFAVTGAVLIHPAFAIAPAEDISKISTEELTNNTRLILWGSKKEKFALDVKDYILHPEFKDKVTYATIALLDLIGFREIGMTDWKAPVLPICMPVKGAGTYESIYAVKMTDVSGEMEKEIVPMAYVQNQDCEEFYYKAQLTYTKMNPVNPLCAVSTVATKPCVWDGGTALITRQSWGFWKLLGFAVRGPGCGAPARFLNIHDYLPWINDVITQIPYEGGEIGGDGDILRLGIRRVSPIKLVMYKADYRPESIGQCHRKERGAVLYKDSSEFATNGNFVQGFFFVVITMIAEFRCALVRLDVNSRTNAAIWVEHNCHPDVMGEAHGATYRLRHDRRKMTCFFYYKTAAFIELRFFFSFKASIEVTLYGVEEKPRQIPNPFKSTQYTYPWWPTPDRIKWQYFAPAHLWWYYL